MESKGEEKPRSCRCDVLLRIGFFLRIFSLIGYGVVRKERLVNNYRLYFSVFSIIESCRFQEAIFLKLINLLKYSNDSIVGF
jgi:hypothetical protein